MGAIHSRGERPKQSGNTMLRFRLRDMGKRFFPTVIRLLRILIGAHGEPGAVW